MTDGVSLNVNGLVLKSATEVDSAFKAGKISKEMAARGKAMFEASASDPEKYTTVKKDPDSKELSPEEKAKKDAAHNKEVQMQQVSKDLAKAWTAMAEAKTPEEKAAAQKLLDAAQGKFNELTKNTPTGLTKSVDAGDMVLDPSGKAHLKVPTQKEIDEFGKDYTTAGAGSKKQANANLRKTFGQSHASDSTIEKTKDELKAAEKQLKADEKAYNKQRKETVGHRGKNFTGDNIQKTQDAYDKLDPNREQITAMKGKIKGEEIARDIAEGRRDRTVRRMRKHIEEAKANMQSVHDIDYAVPNKAAKKAFLAAHPDVKPEQVSVLNKKERNASMVMMLGAANRVNNAIEKYNKSHSEADKKLMDETMEKYSPYLEAFGAKKDEKTGKYSLSGQEQLVIKAKPYQEALANLSGKDFEFNIDEVQAIHDQTGLSKHAIRSTVKEYGFGAENKNWLPWVAALGTAATVGLLENLFDHKKVAEAHSHDERTSFAEASDSQTVTVEVPGYRINYTDPITGEEDNWVRQGQSATATASAYASTYAHSVADASARAVAKIPFLSRLAGPVGAGIAAFIACKPEARDVFNGNVDAVLNDLNLVKGTEAKAFVYQIQNMEFVDGNGEKLSKQQADVIKAAVLKAAMGGETKKMNETELAAAFLNLQETQKQIKNMKIEPLPEPEPEPSPNPNPEPVKKEYHADGNNVYTVEKNDILGNIAKAKYPGVNPYKAMKAIQKANGLKDINSLVVGQTLELPEIDGVKPTDAAAKKHIGGKKIKFRPTKTNAQETGTVYEGKEHKGSHNGENVVDTYTGKGAKARAKERAAELNNQSK